MLNDFETAEVQAGETRIFIRRSGSGSPILLLHGFPQTHLMWRDVAPLLARHFTVVCADLRGYGRSGCPASTKDHAPYAKRAMARDMVAVMEQLGFPRFSIAGHDRGGRVAYRLALDHPERVERLAVLDILPTATVWERADMRLPLAYWPWSLLAQSEPLPERFIAGAPEAVVDNALGAWGSPSAVFGPEVRAAYVEALRDLAHDQADRKSGRRIACPLLALWSANGPLDDWYAETGGPLSLWRDWANEVQGGSLPGGHFFPEEIPDKTADALIRFFSADS
jgi:haloacetate dehalogenase